MESNRCVGCQWRVPVKMGGQGIICHQHDGKCPNWAIKWAIRYGKIQHHKGSTTEEDLLETMRL